MSSSPLVQLHKDGSSQLLPLPLKKTESTVTDAVAGVGTIDFNVSGMAFVAVPQFAAVRDVFEELNNSAIGRQPQADVLRDAALQGDVATVISLIAAVPSTTSPHAPSPRRRYCDHCGAQFGRDSRVCDGCGAPATADLKTSTGA